MKSNIGYSRLSVISAILISLGLNVSCVTTYDRSGRPVQTVDPVVAVAGVAAAGLIGYAASNNRHHGRYHNDDYYEGGGYDNGPYPRGGYGSRGQRQYQDR